MSEANPAERAKQVKTTEKISFTSFIAASSI
jgi:hypothetical protein